LAPAVNVNPVPKQPAVDLQAQFLIDKLDGDPADTSNGAANPESCVLVTQRHEFYREGTEDPCEASWVSSPVRVSSQLSPIDTIPTQIAFCLSRALSD
jgi:hypothetical protein